MLVEPWGSCGFEANLPEENIKIIKLRMKRMKAYTRKTKMNYSLHFQSVGPGLMLWVLEKGSLKGKNKKKDQEYKKWSFDGNV